MRWPVVGRESELGLIRSLLEEPDTSGVLLVGPTGVGKTRLSREILGLLGDAADGTAWVAASASTQTIPFGAVLHLLPSELPNPPDQLDLLRHGQQALAGAAARAGGLLVVDDAHLLDDLSATALAQHVISGSVFVALTVPEEWQLPDPLARLWKGGLMERMEITPLDRPAVDGLAETVLGGPVDGRTRQALWRLSAGEPLLVRELLLGARESGILTQRAGLWRHRSSLASSARIREVVADRLGWLGPPERDVIDVLALAEPMGVAMLERTTSAWAIEGLEAHQLVDVWEDGARLQVETAHPLYAEVVADGMPRTRARRIWRRLADVLVEFGCRRREDTLRSATWSLESGSPSDPAILVRASRQAHLGCDHTLGERLARAAMNRGGGFDAALSLAEAMAAQGRLDEAERLTTELADDADSDTELTRAVLARADLLVFQRGDQRALDLLEQTAVRVSNPDCRDELEAMLVLAAAYLGELPRAIDGGRGFLARDDPTSDALIRVLVAHTYARPLMGSYAGLNKEIDRGLTLAAQHPDAFPLAEHLLQVNQGFALRSRGHLLDAEQFVRARYADAMTKDARDVQGMWATQIAHTLDMRGHVRKANRYYDEALASLEEHDPVGMRLLVMALAAHAAALAGHRGRAQRLLAACEDDERPAPTFGSVWEARARAWLAYLDGDLARAGSQARLAGDTGQKEHLLVVAALAFHDAARLGQAGSVTEQLASLEAQTEGDLVPLLSAHTQALAEGDARHLDTIALRFEELGADLYAAETAAQAAHLHKQAGRHRSHRRARARASLLAERCPGVSTPWLWQERPRLLTPREFEIATIAARGLTNREISERLEISPRTVGNHLASVYSKLDVAGRNDLEPLLDIETDPDRSVALG